jgi:sterol desaturase/sphingolipid hydroxylase (fatty acid hydroxylase superfamily)
MLTWLALDFLRLCLWLLIIMMVFVPLERIFTLHPQKIFRKGFVMDLGYYFLSSMLPKIILIVPMALVGYIVHRLIPAGYFASVGALPVAIRFAGAMTIGELGFYWGHRWSHEIPFLWRFHAIHHSAEEMDWLVNTRTHPIDMVFTRLCGFIPIYILGFSQPARGALDFVSLLVIFTTTLWGFFIHANVKWRLGPLEWFVTTPVFHHWHHTYDEPLNRNFSSLLPWMDRLFGTYYAPKSQWPSKYGTEAVVAPGLSGQLLQPFTAQANGVVARPAFQLLPATDGSEADPRQSFTH